MRSHNYAIGTLLVIAMFGCKIVEVVPEGGSIASRTGRYDCAEGQTCEIDVENGSVFRDTFKAVPNQGYIFRGWKKESGYLCGGTSGSCALENIPGKFTRKDVVTYLAPVFESDRLSNVTATLVRVIYAIPSDRSFNGNYSSAIEDAIIDLKKWYKTQLKGKSFSLYSSSPEVCNLPRNSNYYLENTWSKVTSDIQSCAEVRFDHPEYIWVVYADVVHACDSPGRIGAGTHGLTILARQALQGLSGVSMITDDCGRDWYSHVNRWIGGLGHELGHAFMLRHAFGCDEGLAYCDASALMWTGFANYPDTYYREDELEILRRHPAIQ